MHQIPQPILLLLLLPLCLIACHTGNGSATVTGNAAAPLRSPRYHADSLRFLAATEPLYDQRRERETIPYLDSIFLLPASLNPDAPQHCRRPPALQPCLALPDGKLQPANRL